MNQIKTLADFQHCRRLQELYIRKNDIRDLRGRDELVVCLYVLKNTAETDQLLCLILDVCYLKGLPNLKNLWLADNPCAEIEGIYHESHILLLKSRVLRY